MADISKFYDDPEFAPFAYAFVALQAWPNVDKETVVANFRQLFPDYNLAHVVAQVEFAQAELYRQGLIELHQNGRKEE